MVSILLFIRGLKGVVVKSGEKVISKQKIGTVVTSDSSGETELHFEIWKGKDPQNPVKWAYKKLNNIKLS